MATRIYPATAGAPGDTEGSATNLKQRKAHKPFCTRSLNPCASGGELVYDAQTFTELHSGFGLRVLQLRFACFWLVSGEAKKLLVLRAMPFTIKAALLLRTQPFVSSTKLAETHSLSFFALPSLQNLEGAELDEFVLWTLGGFPL